jgi:tetratricopeptide (TPR) repeat protein
MALVCAIVVLYAAPAQSGPPPNLLYTGYGGKGKSLAILAPRAAGLAKGQEYLPALLQRELAGIFSGYSAIAVLDRARLDEQYKELESLFYGDNAGGDPGRLSPADYILGGTVTRTAAGYTLDMRVIETAGKMTAASFSGSCTFTELDDFSVIRRAAMELLRQLGVELTTQARQELAAAATANYIQAQTALARGITAQRGGTTVGALYHYYQAVSFDPALRDARLGQLAAQVTGGLGAGVKNDFQARRDWLAVLKECAVFMKEHPPYELLYDPAVKQEGVTDYAKETAVFTLPIALSPSASGFKVLNDLLAGLDKTGRRTVWGFDGWPFLPLTPAAPEALLWGGKRNFTVTGTAALMNAGGKTLGQARFTLTTGGIGFSAGAGTVTAPPAAAQVLRIANVNANDLTDLLTVRILNVNGKTAEAVSEAGYMRIAADTTGLARQAVQRIEQERQRDRDRQEAANYLNSARAHNNGRNYYQAVSDAARAIQLDPNNAVAYNSRGTAYSNLKLYSDAVNDYTQAIRLNPNNAEAYSGRGAAYHGKGDYDEAIADYTQAIRLNPNNAVAYSNRGVAYREKGDCDKAIEDYIQAIRLNPNNAMTYSNRGAAYYQKGDNDKAIADYTQAIRLNPNFAMAYNNRGLAYYYRGITYREKGDNDKAIADYTQAIRLNPNFAEAYSNRGVAYHYKGSYNRAITDLEKALRIDPDNYSAREQLLIVRKARGW